MVDLPPELPIQVHEPFVERLVECGLDADGITVVHVPEHQYSEITIASAAQAREAHLPCIREAVQGEFVLFDDTQLGRAYEEHVFAFYRPRWLAETKATLTEMELLDGFPQRSDFADFEGYIRALESHAGFREGSRLVGEEGSITLLPRSPGDYSAELMEEDVRLIAVVLYASLIDDIAFAFIGNEVTLEDD